MIRNFILGLLIFIVGNTYSQKNVNDFKYVIVPESYVFLDENDQYQLNSLTKFLFEKYGFTAFIRGQELPEELKKNGCTALLADVQKKPGLFLTKLIVELKDCNGAVIFTTTEGQSREKEFKKAYQEALRDAFEAIQRLNYTYNETSEAQQQEPVTSDAVISQPATPQPVQKRKQDNTEVATPTTIPVVEDQLNDTRQEIAIISEHTYSFNAKEFIFKKEEYGYEIFVVQENNRKSIGKIFTSSRENTYIIKAGDYSGNGYFDAYGNFILERINPVTNKVIKDIFARQ